MLEMPTGTGKTLALLASTLTWLEANEEKLMAERLRAEDRREAARHGEAEADPGGAETAPRPTRKKAPLAWIRTAFEAQQRETAAAALRDEDAHHRDRMRRAETLRREMKGAEEARGDSAAATETAEGSLGPSGRRQAARALATLWRRKQERERNQGKEAGPRASRRGGEDGDSREIPSVEAEDPEEFLVDLPVSLQLEKKETGSEPPPLETARRSMSAPRARKTQVIISSRTHSQLRQYVEELRRIQLAALAASSSPSSPFSSSLSSSFSGSTDGPKARCLAHAQADARAVEGDGDDAKAPQPLQPFLARLKVAVVGGRDRLCINPTECMDIEDLTKVGCSSAVMACPYFAAKEAAKEADIILMPTSALLADHQRDALDVSLEGAVVVIDEAHHVPRFLAAAASSSVEASTVGRKKRRNERRGNALKDVVEGVGDYLLTYQDRLRPNSTEALLQVLRFATQLFEGLSAYPQTVAQKAVASSNSTAARTVQTPQASGPFSSSSASCSSFASSDSFSPPQGMGGLDARLRAETETAAVSQFPAETGERRAAKAREQDSKEASFGRNEERHAVFSPSQFLRQFQLGDFALHELLLVLSHPASQMCRKLRGFLMRKNSRLSTHVREQTAEAERRAKKRPDANRFFRAEAESAGQTPESLSQKTERGTKREFTARARPFHSTCLYTLRAFIEALLRAGPKDKILLRFPSLSTPLSSSLESQLGRRPAGTSEREATGGTVAESEETQKAFAFSSVQIICLDEGELSFDEIAQASGFAANFDTFCILMGGTMEPRLRFAPLHAALPPSSIFPAFAGSHVIAKENLLLLPLARYQQCTFDSRFSERWRQREQQEALLQVLIAGAEAMPPGHGLVVFFSSFSQLRAFSFFFHNHASPAIRAMFQRACPHIFIEHQDAGLVAMKRSTSLSPGKAAASLGPSTARPFLFPSEKETPAAVPSAGDRDGRTAGTGRLNGEQWTEAKKREREREKAKSDRNSGLWGDSGGDDGQLATWKGGVTYGRSGALFEAYKRVLMRPDPKTDSLERPSPSSTVDGTGGKTSDRPTGLPRNAHTTDTSVNESYGNTQECATQKAALFCVMNGAFSEGVNFHDSLARLLVLVGLPFPSVKDPEFQLRAAFFSSVLERTKRGGEYFAGDTLKNTRGVAEVEGTEDAGSGSAVFRASQTSAHNGVSVHPKSPADSPVRGREEKCSATVGLAPPYEATKVQSVEGETRSVKNPERKTHFLAEQDPTCRTGYGLLQCMQTVNQTIGRAIRHSQDYAAVLLVDYRYTENHIETLLSPWIKDALYASRRHTEQLPPSARDWTEEETCREGCFGVEKATDWERRELPDKRGALTTRLAAFFKRMEGKEAGKGGTRDSA
ncbi:putative helicase [Neospora caninum Liverpool]|uniref:Putative helicase n=1 Tax=Neospora caninum (strain Liverpool) TaxID=572307 RepID=F0VPE4_NEOCL|nr:putative helicase [Neospora caninum Liverpool]CBZ55590.1 putative helicase [Neospora caninum Liverpool]|eukprot:XP_003885618.1 putative helicase [Neospora caninum Liverpool]